LVLARHALGDFISEWHQPRDFARGTLLLGSAYKVALHNLAQWLRPNSVALRGFVGSEQAFERPIKCEQQETTCHLQIACEQRFLVDHDPIDRVRLRLGFRPDVVVVPDLSEKAQSERVKRAIL